jgi:hypothetical protein
VVDSVRSTWPNLGEEERKILLDYSVYDVEIIVEPVPGKLRANTKSAAVVLRTAPNDPKLLRARPSGVHRRRQFLQDRRFGFH